MLEYTLLVAKQVAILFVIMGTGALAAKTGWLNGDGAKQMTNIVLYLSTPCIIVNSFLSAEFTPELVDGIIKTALFAVAIHVFGIVLSRPFLRKEKTERRSIYGMSIPFSNCGFMGIPLASGILGTQCVVYISVYIAIFNLFAWTYGVALFQPGKKVSLRAMVVNPGTMSLIAGLIIAALRWQPPELLYEPIRLLAALNSPVAMIVLGYYLCTSSLKPLAGEGKMWAVMAMKLAAVPAAALCVSMLMGLSGIWLAASFVMAAAPCATNVLMFAARFNGGTGLAARTVSYSTLFSLVTMPVFLGIALALNPVV